MQDKLFQHAYHNYVDMQLIYVNMQHNYADIQHSYINMQDNFVFCLRNFMLQVNILILDVDINKSDEIIIMLYIDIYYLACRGRLYCMSP